MTENKKYCIVPGCQNTSTETPNKLFISVPMKEPRRSSWFKAVRTANKYSSNTSIFVCEDHFNLEEDAENWMQIRSKATRQILMKQSAVPHIFECEPGRTEAQTEHGDHSCEASSIKSALSDIPVEAGPQHLLPEENADVSTHSSPGKGMVHQQQSHLMPSKMVTLQKRIAAEALCELASGIHVQHP